VLVTGAILPATTQFLPNLVQADFGYTAMWAGLVLSPGGGRHDGDDVSMEKQVNEMMKNQQQHNLAIGIMSAQFRLLRAAITERVA